MTTMRTQVIGLAFCIAAFAMSATAQTITGSGTAGKVPVFTGTSTIGNSVITQSGSDIGIGAASPGATLEVNGGVKLTSGSGGSITFQDGTVQTTALPDASANQQFLSVDTSGVAHAVATGNSYINAVVNGGIDNTGATDMSSAIATLINGQCTASTPAPIYFPAGKYLINSGVLINATSTTCYGLHVRGAGPALTIFETNCSGNTYGIWYDNTTNSGDSINKGFIFEDFSVVSTDTTGLCNSLLRLTQKNLFVINRVHTEGAVGNTYATGTIGISSSTVTGSGTTFTAAMVPGVIQVAGVYAEVCTFGSTTSLTLCDSAFPTGTVSSGASYALTYGGMGLMLDPGNSFIQYGSIHDYSSYNNRYCVYAKGGTSGGVSRFTFDGEDSFCDPIRLENSVGYWLGKLSDTFTIDTPINNASRCWVIDSGHANKIGGKCENNTTWTPVSTCNSGTAIQACDFGAEISEQDASHGYGNIFSGSYIYLTGTAFKIDNASFNLQILGFQADDSFSNTNSYSFNGTTGCPASGSGVAATILDYDCVHTQVAVTVN
jgi:hypothetical protein